MSVSKDTLLRTMAWIGLGLLIGIGFGLFFGWAVWPIEYTEADPTVLEEAYERDYTVLIATAYSSGRDLTLANQRLASLGKEDPAGWLLSVTVNHILDEDDENEIRHLVLLSRDLGLYSPAMEPYLEEIDADTGQ